MTGPTRGARQQLTVLSANVRGLRTNIGDLTHNFVLRHCVDVVVVTETWLDEGVESTFGKIRGYSPWVRRDRQGRPGGGVAVCFREGVQAQTLPLETPPDMESLFFRVVLADGEALLVCAMYRPPQQGPAPLDYLTTHLDDLMTRHRCSHVLIIGDLNHHLEQAAYESLLAVQGLGDYVTFPTHERGGTLDPVITDLQEGVVNCEQLGSVGSSDHYAVLTRLDVGVTREEAVSRTIWLWDRADWPAMRRDLSQTDWASLLSGGAEEKTRALTTHLLNLQERHVPHRCYTTKPTDQPWFGYRCRLAAGRKYSAWLRYKRNPTRRNKELHRAACRQMRTTSRWAIRRWEDDMKRKLRGPGIGSKTWWTLVKERQGTGHQDTIPPLTKPDSSTATSSKEKAELLADLFAAKMTVGDPRRQPPQLNLECDQPVTTVEVIQEHVEHLLRGIDVKKATGPDNVSPQVLKHCAGELSGPLSEVFKSCLEENTWPSVWKEARVVPVHKRNSRSDPKNYRPISLLSVVGKVFERIVAEVITHHLDANHLLSHQQFGFRPGRSTSDLLLLLSRDWQDALDEGLDTLVVALDIAGAFDRVWHAGLLEKLHAKGVQGNLLLLLSNYLQGRTLQVVVNGQSSRPLPVEASVPQGSVLGPILWNIYINDLLQLLPTISAYADDCTLSRSYCRQDSQRVTDEINQQLHLIKEWGARWQVDFAPEKTQAMVISRSPAASQAVEGRLHFGDAVLPLQDHVKILGVDMDCALRFDRHLRNVAHQASLRVTALRRVAKFLDERGLQTLYKAQVRPYLEYATLTWMSSAPTHLQRLEAVERRAKRLLEGGNHPPPPLDSLEHRRDVAALVVFHKAKVQGVPHLDRLRVPPRVLDRSTRTVLSSNELVEVPRSHTSQHQRTFASRVSRLWNTFVAATPDVPALDTQGVKLEAHRWRGTLPTPLVLTLVHI